MIDQYFPHDPSRNTEKVLAVLPPQRCRINQAQVGLVDQRGRLQRVATRFLPEPGDCELLELRVKPGQKLVHRFPVSGLRPSEKQRRVGLVTFAHGFQGGSR